ncbi:MAG TPA: aminotransferase class I/II-fold pyridoxal phosphate-dependent enzyme, partial [Candidatus Sulfotelmatobacter sp.]|nr:aminotransferase class I/II-fold pyridoxal phosphate-dependent enzyme [Candidatus Sulfotelmatobacter sp.]
ALRLYPAPRADEFVASAARLYSIPQSMILAGNGSDELLAMVFRATLGSGDSVAYPVPTYSLYDTLALVQEARILHFPVGLGFELPLDALANTRANLTIVCSPNSPSGTLTPARDLGALAKRLDGRLLVIDEAYVDFAGENALGLVRRHRNIVVLRTLSKSYSLAGMRLGLCFAHPPVIDALMKVKDSYNLSRVALAAGAEALRDSVWMRRNVEKVIRTRARTEERLRKLGFEVPPSQANFVLARMPGRDMAPVTRGLRRAGILVRHFATPLLQDALRISIGTPTEMDALFKALAPLVRATPTPKAKRRAPA